MQKIEERQITQREVIVNESIQPPSLPLEILEMIYLFLPSFEQYAVVPLVSKFWRDLSQTHYEKYLKNGLIDFQTSNSLIKTDIDTALKINKNDFIKLLKNNNPLFPDIDSDAYYAEKTQLEAKNKCYFEMTKRFFLGKSKSVSISWDPQDLQISDKANYYPGSFCYSFLIKAKAAEFMHPGSFFNYQISAECPPEDELAVRKWWRVPFPSKVDGKDTQSKKICKLIKDVLNLQINLYVKYLTNINLVTLSSLNINAAEDVGAKLSFDCDINGLIIPPEYNIEKNSKNKKTIKFYLKTSQQEVLKKVSHRYEKKTISILYWQADNYRSWLHGRYSFQEILRIGKNPPPSTTRVKDILRWHVLSETVKTLVEKSKENFLIPDNHFVNGDSIHARMRVEFIDSFEESSDRFF